MCQQLEHLYNNEPEIPPDNDLEFLGICIGEETDVDSTENTTNWRRQQILFDICRRWNYSNVTIQTR